MDIATRMKYARKERGLSQIETAKTAGISVNSLRLYEAGKRQPRLEQLQAIAEALGMSLSELIGLNPTVDIPENREAADVAAKMLINLAQLQENGKPWERVFPPDNTPHDRISSAFDKLNPTGQAVAVERVEELTEIPKYQNNEKPPEVN